MHRFYVPTDLTAGVVELDGPEAHHALHVLRMGPGDDLALFDGRGNEVRAVIRTARKGVLQAEIVARVENARELPQSLILATAVPKGDRFKWLVEKAVELGVATLIPLIARRSVVEPGAGRQQKLRQTIVEASKQCGRARLMELAEPMRLDELFALEAVRSVGVRRLADPSGSLAAPPTGSPATGAVGIVGPEGGWTLEELDAARQHGCELVSLGRRVLRVETAAMALAAQLALELERSR